MKTAYKVSCRHSRAGGNLNPSILCTTKGLFIDIYTMLKVWTIGHSTLDLTVFIALLKTHRIVFLADIRRYPASRRYPHFNADALASALAVEGIGYRHF